MRSRMKFSPNFFLMQHTALLYCHKGCVFTVKQPNALSIKAYWHKVCSWFIDKYSGDVIWKMFEQVDSSRKHFKDGKISLSSLSFILFTHHKFSLSVTSLFFWLFLSSCSICVNSHICPLNLSGSSYAMFILVCSESSLSVMQSRI